MKKYGKYIIAVIAVSVVSYILQLTWINIVEPIMKACGVSFRGILPTGEVISAVAVFLINISGAVVLAVIFNGSIPIWLCLFYSVLYTVFLIIYSPGRIEFSLSENFFSLNSIPFGMFVREIIPFTIARLIAKRKNKVERVSSEDTLED